LGDGAASEAGTDPTPRNQTLSPIGLIAAAIPQGGLSSLPGIFYRVQP